MSFNRGNGISEIEGKGAQGSAERVGRRVRFNRGNGISEIEGKGRRGDRVRARAERVSNPWFFDLTIQRFNSGEAIRVH